MFPARPRRCMEPSHPARPDRAGFRVPGAGLPCGGHLWDSPGPEDPVQRTAPGRRRESTSQGPRSKATSQLCLGPSTAGPQCGRCPSPVPSARVGDDDKPSPRVMAGMHLPGTVRWEVPSLHEASAGRSVSFRPVPQSSVLGPPKPSQKAGRTAATPPFCCAL